MKKDRITEIWSLVWSKVIAAAILGSYLLHSFLYSFLISFSYNEFINGIIDSLTRKRYLEFRLLGSLPYCSILLYRVFDCCLVVAYKICYTALLAIGIMFTRILNNMGKNSTDNQSISTSEKKTVADLFSSKQEKKKKKKPPSQIHQ